MKEIPLASSAGENPHNGGKSPNYRDTTEGGFSHSSQRQGEEISRSESPLPSARQEGGYATEGIDVLSASVGLCGRDSPGIRAPLPNTSSQRAMPLSPTLAS